MSSKKVFYILIAGFGLTVCLVVASIVVADLLLHKQANKLVDLKLQNKVVEQQQVSLLQAKKDVEKYSDLDKIAKQIIPQDKDQARATREILNIANAAGIKLGNISFPASTLGQTPPKQATTDTSNTNSKTSTSTTPSTPAAPATPSITQVKPVDGLQNVYQFDITVTSDTANPVSYTRLVDFLNRLEQNRRTAQVTQISIQPDSLNRNALNFNLTITLYIKP